MLEKNHFIATVECIARDCSFEGCNSTAAERLAEDLFIEINSEMSDKENIIAILEKRVLKLEEGLKEIRNSVMVQSPNWIADKVNRLLEG